MTKKILAAITLTLGLLLPLLLVTAHSDHPGELSSFETILDEISAAQGVKSLDELECGAINEEQFEAMGEAIMSRMHPDEGQHELMDEMMGGEGSESLRAAHIMMGQRYLGCASGMMNNEMMGGSAKMPGGMMGMMGISPMGMMPMMAMTGSPQGWSLRPGFGGGYGWLNSLTMVLIWLLLIVAIIALLKWLFKKEGGEFFQDLR